MLELQPAFASSVGHCLHAAMVLVPGAVEHDSRDPRVLGPGSDPLAHFERLVGLLPALEIGARHREQRAARDVVDDLRRDVLQRAEDDETRSLARSRHLLAHPEVTPVALLLASLRNSWHGYLPPALPALRRITSPWYLMPLPLYGSGGRSPRSSAATCPTSALSEPSMRTVVGFGAVSLMPVGARYSIGCEKPSASCSPNGFTSALKPTPVISSVF